MGRKLLLVFLALAAGCRTTDRTLPTATAPPSSYVTIDAPSDIVWDEVMVDTGTEWEFINDPLRLIRLRSLMARGPIGFDGARSIANPEGARLADCGSLHGIESAGHGDLWAAVAIRVREDDEGRGMLKVLITDLWQIQEFNPNAFRQFCISTGEFERDIVDLVRTRGAARTGG